MKKLEKRIQMAVMKIPGYDDFKIEETSHHVSTEVYRLVREEDTYYLRIGNKDESMWPEVLAHNECQKNKVAVPKVVYFDLNNRTLDRSIMITTKIEGEPVTANNLNIQTILFDAGKNLARLNSILVDGIGWMNRENGIREMRGVANDYNGFILEDLPQKINDLTKMGFFEPEITKRYLKYMKTNSQILLKYRDSGFLAHGDFDLSHIFCKDGIFSGIIDLGDIRSTGPFHDLAHFFVYSHNLFPHILEGYRQENDLPKDHLKRIEVEAMALAINKLAWVAKNLTKINPQERSEVQTLIRVLK